MIATELRAGGGSRRNVSTMNWSTALEGTARILSFLIFFLGTVQVFAAAPAAPKPSPNVILITIDTVRADHLGCYGAKNIRTPTLDALARDGIVFERAISQVPLTWPSHAAILTGQYPFQSGVQDFTGQPLDARFRSVAQAFKQRGYATGAVVSAFVLDRSWGLARGFDFYDDAFPAAAFAHRDLGLVDRRAGESVDHTLTWLQKNPRRPFFFWLHLYDPHSPYDPPEPYRSQYQGHLYDGEIAYADHELGRLMAWLKRKQLYDSSLIMFLSDHGESLGEHGEHEHGFFVYNATVHIPLIVKLPAGSGIRPGRVSRPVETTAVAPTLMQASRIHDAMEKQFSSPSLFQNNAPLDDAAYSETFYPFSSFGWSPLHALETNRFHYIDAPQPELYDVVADPEEKNNLAAQQTATVAVLKDKLQALLRERPYAPVVDSSSGLSPDALDKLRALGYVAYRSPVSSEVLAGGLADPKSKLLEFNSILEAEDALQAGNAKRAEEILAPVQQQDPKMYVIPFLLGETALRNQDWTRAAEQLQRCMDLNPSFDNAMTGLARALAKLGRTDDAKNWLKKATASNFNNYRAWYELGLLEAGSDLAAAQVSYEKAIAIQPNFSVGQRELGMLLFNQKSYAAAVPKFEKAIALGLNDAPLYNFLGICYNQTHQLQKSIRSHQAALKLDPKLAEAHLNLAYDYQLLNQPKTAREEYQQACNLEQRFCKFVPPQ
jgi:arylsulfatase A-like enzyme/Flp pilus assembly protein TadD